MPDDPLPDSREALEAKIRDLEKNDATNRGRIEELERRLADLDSTVEEVEEEQGEELEEEAEDDQDDEEEDFASY